VNGTTVDLAMAAYPFLFENRRRLQHRHDMPPASGHHQLSAITPDRSAFRSPNKPGQRSSDTA